MMHDAWKVAAYRLVRWVRVLKAAAGSTSAEVCLSSTRVVRLVKRANVDVVMDKAFSPKSLLVNTW